MKRSILTLLCFAVSATMSVAAPGLKDRKDEDRKRILGNWTQESLSQHGSEPKGGDITTFRFGSDGSCGITHGAQDGKEFGAQYSLDPSQMPRRMKWLNGLDLTEWVCVYE